MLLRVRLVAAFVLVRDLGDRNFLMLRNHGLLTVGKSIADAFLALYIFEATCMIQVRAQNGGDGGYHRRRAR